VKKRGSVMQCDALCCSVLQCVAFGCSLLNCIAVKPTHLQYDPPLLKGKKQEIARNRVAVICSVMRFFAVCCSVLQCVAVCCSVLQCVAVCCSVLQCVAVRLTSFSE